MSDWPTVAVVVLNYNGTEFIEKCLISLNAIDYPKDKFQIIFIDNNSSDGSVEKVMEKFSEINISRNNKNLGFAAGNNVPMRNVSTKYVCLLNPDTEVNKYWLKMLVEVAEKNPRAGMVGSKVLFMKNTKIIQTTGILLCRTGRLQECGFVEKDNGQYDNEKEIFGPSAVAALYRKEMLDEIGLFDEDFFAYCEDVDLSWRARLSGWKAVYAPKAIVYHWHSGIWGYGSSEQRYFVVRNRLWTIVKNWPTKYILKWFHLIFILHFCGAFWLVFHRGDFSYFKAFFDFFKGLPKMIEKRKPRKLKEKVDFSKFFISIREEFLTLSNRRKK